jgi:hypothetical protein
MEHLEFLDSKQNLFDLIRLRFSFLILDVYAGITRPRRFVNDMTTGALTRRSKVVLTDLLKIAKLNPFGVRLHSLKDLCNTTHGASNSSIIDT